MKKHFLIRNPSDDKKIVITISVGNFKEIVRLSPKATATVSIPEEYYSDYPMTVKAEVDGTEIEIISTEE